MKKKERRNTREEEQRQNISLSLNSLYYTKFTSTRAYNWSKYILTKFND